MKLRLIAALCAYCFINMLCAEEFCMIENQTPHAINVYDFATLNPYCFAGAQPVVGMDIFLSNATLPRVPKSCFLEVRPEMPSIMSHEHRQLPIGRRFILVYTIPFYFAKCRLCHYLPSHALYAYQMIESKPGARYIIHAPHAHHEGNQ